MKSAEISQAASVENHYAAKNEMRLNTSAVIMSEAQRKSQANMRAQSEANEKWLAQ